MKKAFLIAIAIAATVVFKSPQNKIAVIILLALLFFAFVPKMILFAIKLEDKHKIAYRERIRKKKAKEQEERNKRLDKICREVPQERLFDRS